MKLYLMQHGEACSKDVDPERPLSEQGKADVERLAAFLKQAGIHVTKVVHSGKLRALQTAQHLSTAIAAAVELEGSDMLNPNDNPAAFDWQSDSWTNDALLVGHLPFMEKLVSHLLSGNENLPLVAFQPGSIACLERIDGTQWRLNWMIRPELLR